MHNFHLKISDLDFLKRFPFFTEKPVLNFQIRNEIKLLSLVISGNYPRYLFFVFSFDTQIKFTKKQIAID